MRRKKEGISNAARISQAYAVLLVVLVTMIGLATISVVGVHLVRTKRDDANQLMTTLNKTFVGNKPDWDYWRDTANFNSHANFVRVTVQYPDKKPQRFYSHNAKKFLRDNWQTWALWAHIQYQDDQGIYYHRVQKVRHKGAVVTFELWLSLNNMLELFKLILSVIVVIAFIGLGMGIWMIQILARRLNQPLVQLTQAAHTIVEAEDTTYHETLPVPPNPQEVQTLSREFNRLLQSLNTQVIRDHQFVSDASHELRTPLAAIRGHVGLIRRHAATHPEIIPDSLATIESESLKMQRLIERLLALSRMDHAHLQADWFDLGQLVARVVPAYQAQGQQPITLDVAQQVLAYGNQDSIEQILVILLNNAQKYTPTAAPITIQVIRNADQACLRVGDQGVGIADAFKEKVFDRFYRVDASRSKAVGGTGLGLAIAKRLTTLNHGELTVQDNHPQGSVFTLKLPTTTMEP
ncbi:sensor histidine kinase [Lacticaseibacillus baoqingensis]|uniref:histidine kinase n=1 Tax=Lacticaseibacillus baoqingensis TaxID=2486013 RepID=A0ABW4E6G5_9LACO|nr:HAMP domain-containing sensor histidine kinase [Lacticaseibacillus baoqingensis]